ncbi:hypothetical protein FOZ62_013887 [Perkinsus olseni]|uniref:Uncharacterized protein n=1 Tax=Perkinsus olseni TaxID=32597 RepID=A0A7J6QYR9_PEROL|nr:hypothetical protein FOZ62_013887 [Perkinsus olseni]
MFGYTALAVAVRQRNPPLAFELLTLGADPNKGHRVIDLWHQDKESVVILRNLLEARVGKLKSGAVGKNVLAAGKEHSALARPICLQKDIDTHIVPRLAAMLTHSAARQDVSIVT